jgi:hypothetical protein
MSVMDAITAYVIANLILAMIPIVLALLILLGAYIFVWIESAKQNHKNKKNS